MYTLEITSIYNANFYKEIKAESLEECLKIAQEQGYKMTRYEFYCDGVKR